MEWIKEHKKEIAIAAAIIFAYRLGFKTGCRATDNAVSNWCKEASKALQITKF